MELTCKCISLNCLPKEISLCRMPSGYAKWTLFLCSKYSDARLWSPAPLHGLGFVPHPRSGENWGSCQWGAVVHRTPQTFTGNNLFRKWAKSRTGAPGRRGAEGGGRGAGVLSFSFGSMWPLLHLSLPLSLIYSWLMINFSQVANCPSQLLTPLSMESQQGLVPSW